MPTFHETHPEDVTLSLPQWGEWGDSRQVAVVCRACRCVYTGRYWSPSFNNAVGQWIGGVPTACTVCEERKREAERKALPINPALVEAVKAHALANYDHGGWDVIVECYTDAELWELIAGAENAMQAIGMAKEIASLHNERRSECRDC